jgi:hypothetical protein
MNAGKFSTLCACLLLWNILFPMSFIGVSESVAVNRASNAHGHVKDAGERWQLMKRDIDAARAGWWPYGLAIVAFAGVNMVLVVILSFGRYYSPLPP